MPNYTLDDLDSLATLLPRQSGRSRRRQYLDDADSEDGGLTDFTPKELQAIDNEAKGRALEKAGYRNVRDKTGKVQAPFRRLLGSEPGSPDEVGAREEIAAQEELQAMKDTPEMKVARTRKQRLGELESSHKLALKTFGETEGKGLKFEDDGTGTGNEIDTGTMYGQLSELERKSKKKVGMIEGALSFDKEAGQPTDEAQKAGSEAAALRTQYDALVAKRKRIKDEHERVKKMRTEAAGEYGTLVADLMDLTPEGFDREVERVNADRAATGEAPVKAEPKLVADPADGSWVSQRVRAINAERKLLGRKPINPDTVEAFGYPRKALQTDEIGKTVIAPEAVAGRAQLLAQEKDDNPQRQQLLEVDDLRRRGVTHVGTMPIDDFIERFGGEDAVNDARLVDSYNAVAGRLKEIEDTLPGMTGKGARPLEDQRDVLERMLEQKLEHVQRRGLMDQVRDPSLGERIHGAALNVDKGIAGVIADSAEFIARNAVRGAKAMLPGGTAEGMAGGADKGAAQEKIKEYGEAMRAEVEGWNQVLPDQLNAKINQDFLTGDVARGVGTTIGFIGPSTVVNGTARLAGLSEKAVQGLMTATVAASGAAAEGNSFRREAEQHLRGQLESGAITEEDFNRSLGMAELFGAAAGSTEAFTGISRMARRIGQTPAGKSFLRKIFDATGKGGVAGAARWLRGPGRKAAVDVASEVIEESGQEFAQNLAEDVYAKNTFDPGREIGAGPSEAAGSAAVSTAIISVFSQAIGLPIQTRRYKALGDAVKRGAAKPKEAKPATPPQAEDKTAAEKKSSTPPQPGAPAKPVTPPAEEDDGTPEIDDDLAQDLQPKGTAPATPAKLEGEPINKEWTAFSGESKTLGIPRAEMPQIKAEARGALTQFLKARGVEHTEEEILPGDLKPTQAEYSQAKVDKARKFEGGDRAILVSSDGHVLDGHHQWMAKLTDTPKEKMRVIRLNAPIRDLIAQVNEFPSTETAGGKPATQPAILPTDADSIAALRKAEVDERKIYNDTAKIMEEWGNAKRPTTKEWQAKFGMTEAELVALDRKAGGMGSQAWGDAIYNLAGHKYTPRSPAAKRGKLIERKEQLTRMAASKDAESNPQYKAGVLRELDKINAEIGEVAAPAGTVQKPASVAIPGEKPAEIKQQEKNAPTIARGQNSPAAFTKAVTAAAKITIADKPGKFLADFSRRLNKAAPEAFAQMELRVLTQKQWDDEDLTNTFAPDSAAAYSPEGNTIYLNADKVNGENVARLIVHEAGHFAEKFYLTEEFTQREWASLSDDQRFEAFRAYSLDQKVGRAILNDRRARAEWVAMQFARVVRGETEGMSAKLKARLEALLRDIRELVNKWVGDGSLTTTTLDAKILEMLDYENEGPGSTEGGGKPSAPQSPGKARTDTAPTEFNGKGQQGTGKETVPQKTKKRKNISVGIGAGGMMDILNAIEHMGGVKSRSSVKDPHGEYDNQGTIFSGVARLLIRRDGGMAPDELAARLHDDGFLPDGHPNTLFAAVEKAVIARQQQEKAVGRKEYQDRFENAFLGNGHARTWLRAGQPITVDDLHVGDTFEVEGEKFRVIGIDDDGNVTVKDGITKTLPPGTEVYPDKGEVKHGKRDTDFLPEDNPPAPPAPPATPPQASKKPSKFKVSDDLKKAGDALFGSPAEPGEYNRRFGEKIEQANQVVGLIVRDNPTVNSRALMAEFIAEVFPKAKPYSESLFRILSGAIEVDESGSVADWNRLYQALEAPTPPAAPEPEANDDSTMAERTVEAAIAIELRLKNDESPLDWRELFEVTDLAFGGTQAAGTYTVKDAYDALELAVNRFIQTEIARNQFAAGTINLESGGPSFPDLARARVALGLLAKLVDRLPTQSKRTDEQQEMQQFSTPPTLSFAANWVAGLRKEDVYLEPSAGIAGLAVFGKAAGATVIANELSKRRHEILRESGIADTVLNENAENLHAILTPRINSGAIKRPTVVVMNPPFSNSAVSGKRGDTSIGAKHVEEALKLLPPGGRLVAIVGEGMALDKPSFSAWWSRIRGEYDVRANVGVSGEEYRKYGTTFGNQLLVIDKVPSIGRLPVSGKVAKVTELFTLLQGVRHDRPSVTTESAPDQPGRRPDAAQGGRGGPRPDSGNARPPSGNDTNAGGRPAPRNPDGLRPDAGTAGAGTGQAGRLPDAGRNPGGDAPAGSGANSSGTGTPERSGLTLTTKTEATTPAAPIDDEAIFTEYRPAKVHIKGAIAHPTPLVESAAMASVLPPDPTYTPNLPAAIITEGSLSDAQLENIVYAGQAHEKFLPNGERKGYFIGDGTGVGKGRQIAGIILDNLRQGRKRAVWISKTGALIDDAKRDMNDIGMDTSSIHLVSKLAKKSEDKIALNEGIIFGTYTTLAKNHEGLDQDGKIRVGEKRSRLQQLVEYLGTDFDGVIAFDEAHMAGNAIPVRGKRGIKKPSDTGIVVVDLQKLLPKARILYVSATGATEVSNLSYAERLGIWGNGTPFASKQKFIDEISAGGVSSMEIVARDLKALGLYMARTLSFKGVEFDKLTQSLTPDQMEIYNQVAQGWQVVFQNMDAAMDESGAANNPRARAKARGDFFGSQQRFFNQLLTAMEMPAVLTDVRKSLADGYAPVLQLVNTNEAPQDREIARVMSEEQPDLESMDLSPKDVLLQYVNNSFPTAKYEETQDPNNPDRTVWVVVRDAEGNIVEDPQAIEKKNQLLDRIATLRIPENPMEMLLNAFGVDRVAEITGRSQRVVMKPNEDNVMVRTLERNRKEATRKVEAQEFQDGKRDILIFSGAGGTGFSYHASKKAKNQKRRIHYLVQAGWRADAALQGFGRTHRSDQAESPFYKLAATDIQGHKRFISTIARRLAQLGALTAGERKSTGQGLFSEKDNLESTYAEDAITRLFMDLYAKKIEGLEFEDLSMKMGFGHTQDGQWINKLIDKDTGGLNVDKIPTVQQFLNRLLALEVTEQNEVFNAFFSRVELLIDNAKALGEYDPGMQTYHAAKIVKKSDTEVHKHPGSSAVTRIVEVDAINPVEFTKFSEIGLLGSTPVERYVRNIKSGRIYALKVGQPKTTESGSMVNTFRRIGTHGTIEVHPQKDFDPEKYETLTDAQAEEAWDKEIAETPKDKAKTEHFIVGSFLPIWDRIKIPSPKIYRFTTSEGEHLLGALIPPKQLDGVKRRLGAAVGKVTPAEAFKNIIEEGKTYELANTWKLSRVTLSGQKRIEVTNVAYNEHREFTDFIGGFIERVNFRPRLFIPTEEKAGVEAMSKLLAKSPIIEPEAPEAPADTPPPPPPANPLAGGRNVILPEQPKELSAEDRDEMIENIVSAFEQSKKMMPIVPIVELKGTDGNWYRPQGFPWGVQSTGEKRQIGYAFQAENGSTVGTTRTTEQELIDAHKASVQSQADDFLRELRDMDTERLRSQASTWLKKAPGPAAPAGKAGDYYKPAQFNHTKTGVRIYVAEATKRFDDSVYQAAKRLAMQHGGHYSSFKGGGAIPGFHFTAEARRDAFINAMRSRFGLLAAPKEDAGPGLFDGGETGGDPTFNLAAQDGKDFAGEMDRKAAAAEAKKKAEADQMGLFGTPGEPPANPVRKNEPVPDMPGHRYRSHPDSLINAGIETARQIYQTRGNKSDDGTAKAMIAELGENMAAELAMRTETDLPGAIKTALAVNLQVALNKRRFDKSIPAEDRRKAQIMSDRLAQVKGEQFTDMGQAIQFLSRLNDYSPDGVLLAAKRANRQRQDRDIGDEGQKQIDETAEEIQKINEKAIEEATEGLNRALKAVRVGKSIWKRYRDAAARSWLKRIESNLGKLEANPPLKEFTDRLVREVRAKIDAALPPGEKPPQATPIQTIAEAITNREKYVEAWETARNALEKAYADQPEILEKLDAEMEGLLDRPFSKKTLDRAIKEAHKAMGVSVRDLVRMHYSQVDALGQSLADKLVAQAGLKPVDAEQLAQTIRDRFAELTKEAKQAALAKLGKGKTGMVKRIAGMAGKFIDMSNAGALHNADYFEMVAKELKLPSLSEEQAEKLRDLAEKVQAAPEGFQKDRVLTDLMTELHKIRGVGPVDIATSIYYAHILSGYTTQAVNGISTALNTLADISVTVARHPKTLGQALTGMRDGMRHGFTQALAILDTGYSHRHFDEKLPEVSPVLELLSKDMNRNKALRNYAVVLRYVMRAMKAADAVFFYSASEAFQRVAAARLVSAADSRMDRAELNRKIRDLLAMAPAQFEQARQQAKAEKLTGLDYQLRVAELIRHQRDPELVQSGTEFGKMATFNNEPRGYLGLIAKAIRDTSDKFPPLRLFVPFTNIVSNVTNASLNYSPVGVVRAFRGYGKEQAPQAEERDALLIKGIAGTMGLLWLLAYGVGDGDEQPWITANGPKNNAARNQLRATGWKPHSIKIGDAYVSYLETPLAIPLAIVGNYIDGIRYNGLEEKGAGERLAKAVGSVPETIVSMSFLRGMADLMDTVRGRRGWGDFAGNVVSGATVPNLVRQLDRTFDPTLYDTNGAMGLFAGQIPGVRQTFPEKLTVTGQPVEVPPMQRFGRMATGDELWNVIAQKQAWIPEASDDTKLGNRRMTDGEYRRFVRLSGEAIERRLRAALPALRGMTNEHAHDLVKKITREERSRAKARARIMNPFDEP